MSELIRFPFTCEVKSGATKHQRFRACVREIVGFLFCRAAVPGFVRDVELHDEATGNHIRIRPGVIFTVLSVNGRDYYFHRINGKFDGTGSGGCLTCR